MQTKTMCLTLFDFESSIYRKMSIFGAVHRLSQCSSFNFIYTNDNVNHGKYLNLVLVLFAKVLSKGAHVLSCVHSSVRPPRERKSLFTIYNF